MKNLEYYFNSNKVFWVVNKDLNDHIKANDIVPCIYVSKVGEDFFILQFDPKIAFNNYKYTSWRKFLGKLYNTYVDVFLIYKENESLKLVSLKNEEIDFNQLKMSNIIVSEEHLAKFSLIESESESESELESEPMETKEDTLKPFLTEEWKLRLKPFLNGKTHEEYLEEVYNHEVCQGNVCVDTLGESLWSMIKN